MPSVIIVGASRGLGLEFVRQYRADGWDVHASVRSEEDAAAPRELGATTHIADITDEASLKAMAGAIGGPVDVMVINAGVGSREVKLDEVDAAEWTRVMTVNALGPLLVARAIGPKVKDGGTIAALSSIMGSIAESGGGAWSYRMSKAALNMGLSNLALELKGRGIKVVTLHPGWVKTDMGGEQAPLEAPESIEGMRKVIASGSGGAMRDYSGKEIAW
ncbi:SDR family oxidoreductase [Sphingoaurantiacus capsulatus]|uniref:SDR family oxidoreductase n=1 Tax=Sphingoaurantiacus capsulatus TaxID=1771310 RepID=A0ABV7XHK5_9SPHN